MQWITTAYLELILDILGKLLPSNWFVILLWRCQVQACLLHTRRYCRCIYPSITPNQVHFYDSADWAVMSLLYLRESSGEVWTVFTYHATAQRDFSVANYWHFSYSSRLPTTKSEIHFLLFAKNMSVSDHQNRPTKLIRVAQGYCHTAIFYVMPHLLLLSAEQLCVGCHFFFFSEYKYIISTF
jgi:hypothetical protein